MVRGSYRGAGADLGPGGSAAPAGVRQEQGWQGPGGCEGGTHEPDAPAQEPESDKHAREQEFIPVNMFALFILSIFINHNRRDICC